MVRALANRAEDFGMNKWNTMALVLVVMVALQIVLGRAIEIFALEWRLNSSWTYSEMTRLLWAFRIIPIAAIHIGFAYWLYDKATGDNKQNPTLWMVFGLCFGLLAGIFYITIEIIRRLELTSESKEDKDAAMSSEY